MAIVAEMGWKIHQMDVKTTFLNGLIEKEVYIEQPLGFEMHGRESHVCRLKKALYGMKQAPRAWYQRFANFLIKLGFVLLRVTILFLLSDRVMIWHICFYMLMILF